MFFSYQRLVLIFAGVIALLYFSNIEIYGQEKITQNQDSQIKAIISQLYQNHWFGAEIIGESPTQWEFGLTEPMKKILEIGNPAQKVLLENINEENIKDQVIFLLGGVGDEKAVEPIITAMIPKSELNKNLFAKKINRSANLALTNITVADVIWHHGGGIVVERCQENAKECWKNWWKQNKKSFTVKGITQSRRYSNYPNYGIYGNVN